MSLRAAFFIAVFTGVVAGAAAGRLRKMMHPDDESPFPAALYGGSRDSVLKYLIDRKTALYPELLDMTIRELRGRPKKESVGN